ncbi:MAG: RNA polymerase sigma factor RpoD/SigA [Saprospiraceae bacterium]
MRALVITNSITRRDEKSIEKYLTEISRYEVLTPEGELELFQKYRAGKKSALEKIVNHNLRFVVSVAKQYQHLGLALGDLINEGNLGLIKAAQRFDETRGFKFISYAVWWIRQSILDAISRKSRKIRVPANQQTNTSKLLRETDTFLQLHNRRPTNEELSEVTGIKADNIKKSLENYKRCTSLDAPIDSEGDTSLINLMEDRIIPSPDHDLSVRESQQIEVQAMLNLLPPRTRTVLSMYFGIGYKHPQSLDEIGDFVGLSRERVRQIKERGLRKLRSRQARLVPEI